MNRKVTSSSTHQGVLQRGFTLVELLVVIVILGVLSAVVVFAVGGISSSAASAACKSDVRTVESGVEAFHAATGAYPVAGPPGQAALTSGPDATLRSWPSSSQYKITLDATVPGQINVAGPGDSATPVPATDASNPCDSLGSDASSTSTQPPTTTVPPTTTTVPPTTTTTMPDNGVQVTAQVSPASNPWYGENQLRIVNPSPMSALEVTIKVARTPGVGYSGQYVTFWGGTVDSNHTVSSSTVEYKFTKGSGAAIVAGNWLVAAQFSGTGTPRVTSGDTWSVSSTVGGVTSTTAGSF